MERGRALLNRLRLTRHRGPADDRIPITVATTVDTTSDEDINLSVSDEPVTATESSQSTEDYEYYPSMMMFWLSAAQLVLGAICAFTQIGQVLAEIETSTRSKYVGAWGGMMIMICSGVNMAASSIKSRAALRTMIISCMIAVVFAALILWFSQPFYTPEEGEHIDLITSSIIYTAAAVSLLPCVITGSVSILTLCRPGERAPKCCHYLFATDVEAPPRDPDESIFTVTDANHCSIPPPYTINSLDDSSPPTYSESQESSHVGAGAPSDRYMRFINTDADCYYSDEEETEHHAADMPPSYQPGSWVPLRTQIFNSQIECQVGSTV